MASTCRDVITLALRIGKVTGISGALTAAEASLGLEALQSFYLDLAANGMFGRLADVQASSAFTASPGQRIRTTGGAAVTIPTTVARDGCGASPPYDLSLIEVVDVDAGTRSLKLYEAPLGGWTELCDLTLDSPAPLISRGAIGLAATFATSASFLVAFSAALDPSLAPAARSFRTGLIGKAGADRRRYTDDYA